MTIEDWRLEIFGCFWSLFINFISPQVTLLLFISQKILILLPGVPSGFCSLLTNSILEKESATFSVILFSNVSTPVSTLFTITSYNLITRNCWGSEPAFWRVTTASLRWRPEAQALINKGEARSMRWEKTKSDELALPTDLPTLPAISDARFVTPQLQERTSISPSCLASLDSPLMPPFWWI